MEENNLNFQANDRIRMSSISNIVNPNPNNNNYLYVRYILKFI